MKRFIEIEDIAQRIYTVVWGLLRVSPELVRINPVANLDHANR